MKPSILKYSTLIWFIISCSSCYHHHGISTKKLNELYNPTKITIRDIDGKIITNVRVQLEDRDTKETEDAFFHKPTKTFYFNHIGGDRIKITGFKYRPQLLEISTYPFYRETDYYDFFMVKKGKPYYIEYDQKMPCPLFPKYISILSKNVASVDRINKVLDSLGLVIVNDPYFHVDTGLNQLSWTPSIYQKKDGSDFHPFQDPILDYLRKSKLFRAVGPTIGQSGICSNHFSITYWPNHSWEKLETLFSKYNLEVVRHIPDRSYVYLKTEDGMHEGIREVWQKLIEEDMILHIHTNILHPVVMLH